MEDCSAGAARSVRPERPGDEAGVRAVTEAAFPTAEETQLVDRLRADRTAWLPGLSWVAVDDAGRIIAHSLLTRCQVGGAAATALAPCSVDPAQQHRGVGSAVIRACLAAAVERGEDLVLVLGHPEYYPRFGFAPASRWGIRAPIEVPDAAMMALLLRAGAPVPAGVIRWAAAFGIPGPAEP